MNLKQFVVAASLLIPISAISLVPKSAAANEYYSVPRDRPVVVYPETIYKYQTYTVTEESYFNEDDNSDSVVMYPTPTYDYQNYDHRWLWLPGHWQYDSNGQRYWVLGYYVYRQFSP